MLTLHTPFAGSMCCLILFIEYLSRITRAELTCLLTNEMLTFLSLIYIQYGV